MRFHSVQIRLTALVLVLALTPMVTVGLFLMNLSRSEITKELSRSTESSLRQGVQAAEALLKSAEQSLGRLSTDRSLLDALVLLGGDWRSDWNAYTRLQTLYDALNAAVERGGAESVLLYDSLNGKIYCSGDWGDQSYQPEYQDAFFPELHGPQGFWTVGVSPRRGSLGAPSFIYFKPINDQFAAAALIPVSALQHAVRQHLPRSCSVLLLNRDGTPVDGQNADILDGDALASIDNNPGWISCRMQGSRGSLEYIAAQPVDMMIGVQINSLKRTMLLAMLAMAMLTAPLVLLVGRTIQTPVRTILDAMDRVQHGDFKAHIEDKRKDEFGLIYSRFNFMVDQMDLMIDRLYRRRIERQVAEIKALQSQIKPHFLYNTLDTVHWMACMNRTEEIREITFALCRFYRLALSEGEDVVPASEALNLAGEYLKIQQLRYNHRFSAVFDVDPALKQVMVPKLLFQPLVENALLHGIDSKASAKLIRVSGRVEGSLAAFSVWDDGMGIRPERLEEIRRLISSDETRDLFALRNLYNQMRLLTGGEIEMTVDSEYGEWTCITLRFSMDAGREERYASLADR